MPEININRVADIQRHNIQDVMSRGSIKLGNRSYSVTMVNDQIKVHRQDLGQLSTGQKIANGIKDFFSRLFNDGAVTTRSSRLEDRLQGMQRATVAHYVEGFKIKLQNALEFMQQNNHTPQNHAEVSAQCMSDKPETQSFILEHLNDPDFSKDKFTGIENHPQDTSKFIAKFGEKQLEFSNRISSNNELRGAYLKQQLVNTDYENLGELIGKDYLTPNDGYLLGSHAMVVHDLTSAIQDLPQAIQDQVIASVINLPIGFTTVGEAFPHELHLQQ